MKLVSAVIKERICYVEMQNADHFNCLSEEMCQELMESLQYGYYFSGISACSFSTAPVIGLSFK